MAIPTVIWKRGDGDLDKWLTDQNARDICVAIAFKTTGHDLPDGRQSLILYGKVPGFSGDAAGEVVVSVEISGADEQLATDAEILSALDFGKTSEQHLR